MISFATKLTIVKFLTRPGQPKIKNRYLTYIKKKKQEVSQ